MEGVSIFSDAFTKILKEGTEIFQIDSPELQALTKETSYTQITNEESALVKPQLFCSCCKVEFASDVEQRKHYKLDWHRYNLKQKLRSKDIISEEKYNEQIDDLSSTSGESEGSDEEEEETLNSLATAQGKIFLKSRDGVIFSLFKCLLVTKKEDIKNEILSNKLKDLNTNKQWTILMLGGGHFAGAVFQNGEPILHKTFHCYTVRAGQGGAQSSRDNKGGGSQPKSAGASLRRYNETALIQHVKDIVEAWRLEIGKSHLILYRASGPYNRSVLFGGKTPLLERADGRLRTIPFSTKRATFTEVKRVYSQLSIINTYDSVEKATEQVARQKSPAKDSKRNKMKTTMVNRAKSREIVERELPGKFTPPSSGEVSENEPEFMMNDIEISFEGLQEYGDSLTPEQRKGLMYKMNGKRKTTSSQKKTPVENVETCLDTDKNSLQDKSVCDLQVTDGQELIDGNVKPTKKKKKPKKKKNQRLREQEENRKKLMIEILKNGDLRQLEEVLNKTQMKEGVESDDSSDDKPEAPNGRDALSEILDEDSNTYLHIAAAHDQIDIIQYLLERGANPCLKNKKQQTPYTCTQNKNTRDVFKDFAQANPDKYNYNKAQIPVSILSAEEVAEKKRLQRKVKREKEKQKKKENAAKQKEEVEKHRFVNLSDREKCALAAERRILGQGGVVTSRCFMCGQDMGGQAGFNYMNYKFCTINCLKDHRIKNM